MDSVIDVTGIVQHAVEDYAAGDWLHAKGYAVCDAEQQIYAALVVPNYPRKFEAGIVVMARVVNDIIIIDHDTTDTPLVDVLIDAGISRGCIILSYAGEMLPQGMAS